MSRENLNGGKKMSKKYDFETILSRKGQGSYKWEQMYEVLPELEDGIVPFSSVKPKFSGTM